MQEKIRLLMTERETHDAKRFIFSRPEGLRFEPGTAVALAFSPDAPRKQQHPFTPVSLEGDLVLEFVIKRYASKDGFTERLHDLQPGGELWILDQFGSIGWRGQGVFIAGGTGITPFLSILRHHRGDGGLGNSRLIFSNKTRDDVLAERELRWTLGRQAVFTLTRQPWPGYEFGRVDETFLRRHVQDFTQHFYVCGPDAMVEEVNKVLQRLGAPSESLVYEG